MNIQQIIGEIACTTGVPAPAITGSRRSKPVTHARFLAYAAVRVAYPWSNLEEIARAFGRNCHGTVHKGLKRYAYLYRRDNTFRNLATQLKLPPSFS